MAESNNEKKLESMFYEADIIEVGGRNPRASVEKSQRTSRRY